MTDNTQNLPAAVERSADIVACEQAAAKLGNPGEGRAIFQTICGKISASKKGQQSTFDEVVQFATLSAITGLHPASGAITPLITGGRMSVVIANEGWVKLASQNDDYDGYEFTESESRVQLNENTSVPEWIECSIFWKSRHRPDTWRVYFNEFRMPNNPNWQQRPNHMLRVRAMSLAFRRSLGLGGLIDASEAADLQAQEARQARQSAGFGAIQNAPAYTPAFAAQEGAVGAGVAELAANADAQGNVMSGAAIPSAQEIPADLAPMPEKTRRRDSAESRAAVEDLEGRIASLPSMGLRPDDLNQQCLAITDALRGADIKQEDFDRLNALLNTVRNECMSHVAPAQDVMDF